MNAISPQQQTHLLQKISGPHRGQAVLVGGAPLNEAKGALFLVHGRGGDAAGMMPLAELAPEGFAFFAPQAAGHTWYPQRFMADKESNQPALSSALEALDALQRHVMDAGIAQETIAWTGFSQGACLVSDHLLRQSGRFGAAAAFVGGYLGPEGTLAPGEADLAGTPTLLAAGDPDFHVPWSRIEETAEALRLRGSNVDLRRRPGMGHTIHPDDARAFAAMLKKVY